jgi:plasmid stability protein
VAAITVRNLSEETHRALRQRAYANGRSTEAEVRAILDDAALPADRVEMGTLMVDMFKEFGGVELDIKRDPTPPQPIDFG